MDEPSESRSRRVVVTGDHPLAAALVDGLIAGGARVVVLAPDSSGPDRIPCDFASEDEVVAALAAAEERLGGVDQVVHTWVAPGVLEPCDLLDADERRWAAECEGSLEGAWWLARHLSAPLRRAGGGSVVFVVPAIALAGGASYSMLATVAEGIRVLAKGCGRQWAQWGITANAVATAPHHWVSTDAGDALARAISLSVPAFGGVGDVADDLAPLVAVLADPGAHFLTASTLVADGGLWMGL